MSDLADESAKVALSLGDAHIHALMNALRLHAEWSEGARAAVGDVLPPKHRSAIGALLAAWRTEPTTPGIAVALALESAAAAERLSPRPVVELAVTGPNSASVPVLRTAETAWSLIEAAQSRVLIVSFSSKNTARIVDALRAAKRRGVRVDLILEGTERLGAGGASTFGEFSVYVWPDDKRPRNSSLHAKVIVVDGIVAFVTSANLSEQAYERNIELGVVLRGGKTPALVQDHFDSLITRGDLRLLATES